MPKHKVVVFTPYPFQIAQKSIVRKVHEEEIGKWLVPPPEK